MRDIWIAHGMGGVGPLMEQGAICRALAAA